MVFGRLQGCSYLSLVQSIQVLQMTEDSNMHYLTEGCSDQLIIRNSPLVTRVDLDNDIEAGYWVEVGETIDMLVSASGSFSFPIKSDMSSKDDSRSSSIDAARSSELDLMVDNGDWEGVVLIAAKFEANQDDQKHASCNKMIQKVCDSRTCEKCY